MNSRSDDGHKWGGNGHLFDHNDASHQRCLIGRHFPVHLGQAGHWAMSFMETKGYIEIWEISVQADRLL